jgi:hypothetical protein
VTAEEQEYKARIGDYLKTFTSDHGCRVLKDMRKSYSNNIFDPDPITMSHNLGRWQVVRDIEALLILAKNPEQIDSLFEQPEDDGYTF